MCSVGEAPGMSLGTPAVWEPVQLKTMTHVGVRPRGVNKMHQAQAEPSRSSLAWVSSRIIYTWCLYKMDLPSEIGA